MSWYDNWWKLQHIPSCNNKISKTLYIIRSIKNTLPTKYLRTLYQTLIQPHIEYGIIIWGATHESYINKLNVLQKKAIRIISNAKYNEHTSPLFKKLKLLKLNDIYELHLGKFMYKATHNQLQPALAHYFPLNIEIHNYSTRQAGNPQIKLRRTTKASFQINYKGPVYWQDLPNDIKQSITIKQFTSKLKNNLVHNY